MITISLCMIVKDEEETLGRCLESVKSIVDEINIVDTGSTDKTTKIAKKYTNRIFNFKWINDFAAARNFAFQKATKEYILWLDADDVLLEEDQKKLLELKSNLSPSVDAVSMKYNLAYDEHGNVVSSLRRNRLVNRQKGFKWIGAVHEYLEVYGNIQVADISVSHKSMRHDSDRNIMIYEGRLAKGEEFSPRDLYYYSNELLDHQQHEKAIIYYNKFLDTKEGWVEDNIAACGKIADCYNALGDKDKELESTLRSFQYDKPRADFCCRLGFHFLNQKEPQKAVFWYNLATALEKPKDNWGFINHACWTWLPHLQLCICYDQLGNHQLAYHHNEIARSFVPGDWRVLHNKKYLEEILGYNNIANTNTEDKELTVTENIDSKITPSFNKIENEAASDPKTIVQSEPEENKSTGKRKYTKRASKKNTKTKDTHVETEEAQEATLKVGTPKKGSEKRDV